MIAHDNACCDTENYFNNDNLNFIESVWKQ